MTAVKRIVNRFARGNPTAARKLAAEIKRKAKAVSEFPAMGHSLADLLPSLRGFFVDDYIVFYFPKRNSI